MTQKLLELQVGRDAKGGYLMLRSSLNLKGLRDPVAPAFDLGGVPCWRLINRGTTAASDAVVFNYNTPMLRVLHPVSGSIVLNAAFLGAVGLREGVEFTIEGLLTQNDITLFAKQIQEVVRAIYAEHFQPCGMEVTMQVTESAPMPSR